MDARKTVKTHIRRLKSGRVTTVRGYTASYKVAARKQGSGTELSDLARKKEQFRIIQRSNPMFDDVHTGIRAVGDIMTFREAVDTLKDYSDSDYVYPDFTNKDAREALKRGTITIYSSYPIKAGVFVSPSRMNASDYAGGGKVYSKEVPVNSVAWIASDEGQYAPIK